MNYWRRLRDCQEAGIWQADTFQLLDSLCRYGQIDWSRAVVDGSSVRTVLGGRRRGEHVGSVGELVRCRSLRDGGGIRPQGNPQCILSCCQPQRQLAFIGNILGRVLFNFPQSQLRCGDGGCFCCCDCGCC